jgi:hypothetical protein
MESKKLKEYESSLDLVRRSYSRRLQNPRHQSMRDRTAHDKKLLERAEGKEIVVIVDCDDNPVLFLVSEGFQKLFSQEYLELLIRHLMILRTTRLSLNLTGHGTLCITWNTYRSIRSSISK